MSARLPVLAALLAVAAPALPAQTPAPVRPDTQLTLGQAARLAAVRSAPAQAALLRARQADARVTQRRADLLPNVTGAASDNTRTFNTATLGIDFPTGTNPVTGQPNPPVFDPNGQIMGPIQVLDLRARVAAPLLDLSAVERVRAARGQADATRADAGAQAEQAAAVAATSYLRVQRAEAQVENRRADSTLAAELVSIADQQLRAGTGVALDVTRARAQLAGTRAQLIAARNERDRTRLELLRALDLPLDAAIRLTDALTTLPVDETLPDDATAVSRALAQRPDLRAAERQVEAAQRQITAVRAEALPTVGAFADGGATGRTANHLLGTYTWGLQVSVPVFDGFRRGARVEETRAQADEAELRRRDLQAQAAVEVRGALLDLRGAREQLVAARERLQLAELEVSQARDRFRAGVAGNADVVTASQSLTGARTAYVDALSLYQSARVALARAQGAVTQLP
ncbi:TolC family protein [Roseisolibacter agri]|uniref:TolC family protein n=1 Tax=Roseisolibacter agri TaxID=2014610 RepID=UPI0024E1483F|nr:TolC family protein [Roseisolibacter agri]